MFALWVAGRLKPKIADTAIIPVAEADALSQVREHHSAIKRSPV
jgi:hypothetical protein